MLFVDTLILIFGNLGNLQPDPDKVVFPFIEKCLLTYERTDSLERTYFRCLDIGVHKRA